METAPFDPEMGSEIRLDALAELRNHADAEAANARCGEDVERSDRISRMADEIESGRVPGVSAA
jgi:hypothetical protein